MIRLIRRARSKIVTAERALPMLKLSPTAFGCSSAEQQPLDHVVDVAPGADLRAVAVDRQVAAGERRLDERADRAAADLPRPVDVERPHRDGRQAELAVVGVRHVLARELRDRVRPARLADRADASSRSSRRRGTRSVPKTSLVENSISRSTVSFVASAASSTL